MFIVKEARRGGALHGSLGRPFFGPLQAVCSHLTRDEVILLSLRAAANHEACGRLRRHLLLGSYTIVGPQLLELFT